jgi:hypothetical protein
MFTSIQEFEGSGTLSTAAGDPETSVTFAFNIRRTFLDSRPGLPPRPPKTQGHGTVVASDGRVLSEGNLPAAHIKRAADPRSKARTGVAHAVEPLRGWVACQEPT